MKRLILTFLALSVSSFGAILNCNGSNDNAGLQGAMNAAGVTTTVNGPCGVNGTLSANTNFHLVGGTNPTINQFAGKGTVLVNFGANGFSMSGLNFVNGGWNSDFAFTDITLTNNTMTGGGGIVSNSIVRWKVTGNVISDIWGGGSFINYNPPNPSGPNPDTNGVPCWGDYNGNGGGGIDGSVISNNIFRRCSNDGFHINPNGSIHSTNASEISYNQITQVNRAAFEIQAFMSNVVIKGNYAAKFNMPNWNSFNYSIASPGYNLTFINNFGSTSISFCSGSIGVANNLELFQSGTLIQGNVLHDPVANSSGNCNGNYSQTFYTDWNLDPGPVGTSTFRNNIQCGTVYAPVIEHENHPSGDFIIDQQFDSSSTSACTSATIDGSNVSAPVVSPSSTVTIPTGGSGTWNTTQLSDLPIKNTSFFIDGATTPVAFQELQDVNTNFGSDKKWHYHATFSVASLSAGTHALHVVATDVLNATATTTVSFIVGSATGPLASFAPNSLNFGTITVGSSSSPQNTVLTNGGTTSLTFAGGVTITGTNASEFTQTNGCGTSLAAAGTCTTAVTFSPTTSGSKIAFVSITDNAPGSPHTVTLSGGADVCAANIGPLTNCDFIAVPGLTDWQDFDAPYGTISVDNIGPGGTPAAHFVVTSAVTVGSNMELFHPNLTLPAIGQPVQLQFDYKVNRSQTINVLGVDNTTFDPTGIAVMPTLTSNSSWQTYISPPMTITDPRAAGAVRLTFQTDNVLPGDDLGFKKIKLLSLSGSAIVSLSSTSQMLQSVIVGHTNVGAAITISNVGTVALTGISLSMTGTNAADFGQTNTCGSSLAAGTSCTVTPSFSPSALGNRIANISIADSAADTPQIIALSGIGSNIEIAGFDSLDHSSVRIIVNSTFNIHGESRDSCPGGCVGRTRYIQAPATCVGNTLGVMQPQEIGPKYDIVVGHGDPKVLYMDVTGMPANKLMDICPGISKDGGTTWEEGPHLLVTTTPLPLIHPEPPRSPAQPALADWWYPTTTGFTSVTLASDCSDLGTQYTAANGRALTTGTVMLEPVGTHCGLTGNLDFTLKPPDVGLFHSTDISGNTWTLHNQGTYALHVGEAVRFGFDYKANQSWPASTSCQFTNGIVSGAPYFVASIVNAGTNAVTLKCPDNTTPMVFTNTGNDGGLNFNWAPGNPDRTKNFPIILRSAAPDNRLPPPGVPFTRDWWGNAAYITSPLTNLGVIGANGALIAFTNNDGNNQVLQDNMRIGPGIVINHVDSPDAHTSSDPTSWYTMALIPPTASRITFDRVGWDMLGAPHRVTGGIFGDGYYTSFVNNYFDNINYYHANSSMTASRTDATHIGIFNAVTGIGNGGFANAGQGNIAIPANEVVTIGGTGTGEVLIGLDVAASNAMKVWAPTGTTASCAPMTCTVVAPVPNMTDGSCTVTDGWPTNASGNNQAMPLACGQLTSGAVTSALGANSWFTAKNPEGAQWGIFGLGPGPFFGYGNFMRCAGLCLHHDDSGGTVNIRGDITWERNVFLTPFQWMNWPGSPSGTGLDVNPLSDGLQYYNRQFWEEKSGWRSRFKGNFLDGAYVDVEASAGSPLLTSVNGQGILDVDIVSNTSIHSPGIFSYGLVTAGSNYPMTPPVLRTRMFNNLAWDIGSGNFRAGRQSLPPPGWVGEGPQAAQDVILSHNTFLNLSGTNPAIMWNFDLMTEGVSVTDNIFSISSVNNGVGLDGLEPSFHTCLGKQGKPLADCMFSTNNLPNYIWNNNFMYAVDQTPASLQAAWTPGLTNYFQTTSSSIANIGFLNYVAPPTLPVNGIGKLDLGFKLNSPWIAGSTSLNTHNKSVGADIDLLRNDQGIISNVHVVDSSLSPTAFTITLTAPYTSDVCYVDYARNDSTVVINPGRVTLAAGTKTRNATITISGATPGDKIYYRGACQGSTLGVSSIQYVVVPTP